MKIKSLAAAVTAAQQIFKNKDKISEVLSDSSKKANNQKENISPGLWDNIKTLRMMLKAWQSGTYKFSTSTIIYVIAGLLYFISPVDLVPDFILGLGFIDDAAVLALVIKRIKGELDKFKSQSDFIDHDVLL